MLKLLIRIIEQLNLKVIFRIFLLTIIGNVLFLSCSYGQIDDLKNKCTIQSISETFFFEKSQDLFYYDDMILRSPSLLLSKGGDPDYSKGLFVFGTNFNFNKSDFLECKNSAVIIDKILNIKRIERENRLETLNSYETKIIVFNNNEYKVLDVSKLEFVYVGEHTLTFVENQKLVDKQIPLFFILSISY